MSIKTPIALTIAGSDSCGGAGIQADLKTFSARGVYGASVITTLTAQNTRGVFRVFEVDIGFIQAQLEAVLSDLNVSAIKIGMLYSSEIIDVVTDIIRPLSVPIILDPVMISTSGHPLLDDGAIDCLKQRLLPITDLVTPNLPEAARLLDQHIAEDEMSMTEQVHDLLSLGSQAVLLKGGHGRTDQCIDVLINQDQSSLKWVSDRLKTKNTHGTGCTLSAAIAAEVAKGATLNIAVSTAHAYLQQAIHHADQLDVGHGNGPVNHFHAFW